jgi:hypothetical protein
MTKQKLFPNYVDAGHLSGIRAGSIVAPRTCPKSNAQGSMPMRADLGISPTFRLCENGRLIGCVTKQTGIPRATTGD